LVVENLSCKGQGQALDIGCGSGALTIELVKKLPISFEVGIDYWPESWGYSEKACNINANLEKVIDRVSFQKASASSLPFKDEQFDAVVSNLIFHEVRETYDKVSLIKEALRAL
jgi:ubiquinone/menaquinone biosynthesis C-methylase UbiE